MGEEFRVKLKTNIKKISYCCSIIADILIKLDERKQSVLNKTDSMEAEVLKQAEIVRNLLEEHTENLMQGIKGIKTKKLKQIEIEREEIARQLTTLKSFAEYASELERRGSTVDICRNIHDMIGRSDELHGTNDRVVQGSIRANNDSIFFLPSDVSKSLNSMENVVGRLYGEIFCFL